MSSPISFMEAVQIIQKVVALVQKTRHDVPDLIKKVAKKMRSLEVYLSELQTLIDDKSRNALATLRPATKTAIERIIKDIREDSQKVYDLLNAWDKNIGPFGWEMRFTAVAHAQFAFGGSSDKLESLGQDIEENRRELESFLQMMHIYGTKQLLSPQPQPSAGGRPTSPAPPSSPGRKYSIIFVDPYNEGRSVVAEAYMHLLREWTVRTGGVWPLNKTHSAGIRLRNKGDAGEILQQLKPPIPMAGGNELPVKVAMASLFDNDLFKDHYKDAIKSKFSNHKSRGITKNIFTNYDFILVFVGREYESLLLFKQTLTGQLGRAAAPKGKGRIVHLGSYLSTQNGKPQIIPDAAKAADGSLDRGNWNKTTADIKVAVKTFLKKELGWKQPPKGAVQN